MKPTYWLKFWMHVGSSFCLAAGPAAIAMADAPSKNLPYLIVGGLFSAIGAGFVAGKAYMSKASVEDDTRR